MKNNIHINKTLFVVFIISSLIFLFLGCLLGTYFNITSGRNDILIERKFDIGSEKFSFTNPLLECNVNFNFFNTDTIENKIKVYIEKSKNEKKISEIGVYLRLLNNGSILGISEDTSFISASLTKLPLAIAYGKLYEDGILDFHQTILIPKDYTQVSKRNVGADRIIPGKTYKIEELIREMLTNSDNTAAGVLVQHIGIEKLNSIYLELGLPPINIGEDDLVHVSTKDISRFLRVLYNASYLNRAHSEQLLTYLSVSDFKIGIKKGIPSDILVANKFGEVGFLNSNEKQLHDCGIIYYPENPYLLCVMTKGNNVSDLSEVIASISHTVFTEITKP